MRLHFVLIASALTLSLAPAQDKPKAEATAPALEGPTLAAFQVLRYQTKTSLAALTDFLVKHRAELDKMSDRERDEFFAKHLEAAKAQTLAETSASAFPSAAQIARQEAEEVAKKQQKKKAPERPQRGPSAEDRAKFEALSEDGKQRVRDFFKANREKFLSMSEAERKAFSQQGLNKIVAEEAKAKKQPTTEAQPGKKNLPPKPSSPAKEKQSSSPEAPPKEKKKPSND